METEFLPLKELPYKILQHMMGGVDLVQLPTQLLPPSPSTGQGEENKMKKLVGRDNTGRSLTSYCRGQNRFDLGNIILIHCQLN